MKRVPIKPDFDTIPAQFHPLLRDAAVFDSSCSKDAQVIFIDSNGGLFLKSAPKGDLKAEGEMSAYFHSHQLGPEVLAYLSDEKDWLLTRAIPGEDCTHKAYLEDPKRLCEVNAETLHLLHSRDWSACPKKDRTETFLRDARRNHAEGKFDNSLFPDHWGYATPEEAWSVVEANACRLKSDTLIHGDYCLPNVMLDNWRFSGFIDVGRAGVGDKHIDLFWGAWTMRYNLKDDRWAIWFLDAYGREQFDSDMLRVIAAFEVFE